MIDNHHLFSNHGLQPVDVGGTATGFNPQHIFQEYFLEQKSIHHNRRYPFIKEFMSGAEAQFYSCIFHGLKSVVTEE